ncbi:Heterokaryon incompatibility [Pleurostoma richardsiae]|jgi:hypothetical protein|uniref:Heterokaryon incompatibility n=1 Tax=Pleurostoma richardsiae TaxID=41990 RepID=A0AA38RFU4_9PEZI|nr:Heterokaryon incompatibility [Pleurostoma richardsiae]
MTTDDDKEQSLLQLSRCHSVSIVSQLVDIGNVCNQQEHVKFRSFLSSLQCLQPEGAQLRRWSIDAFYQRQYVALSYTWGPSEYEDKEPGQYNVENWGDHYLEPSPVRKCILDRVLHYMRCEDVGFLWIDAHCIRQDTCGASDCDRHPRCAQKRDALQAMDLVYQLSEHPVALLGRPLKFKSELQLLARIISGDLTDDYSNIGFRLRPATTMHTARQALYLLSVITRDRWWDRAWTFQENYRGLPRMRLLIRHDPSLEADKLRCEDFGKIPGELCVASCTFSEQATRLCLALRSVGGLLPEDFQQIDRVLRAAGRYTLLLDRSSCMTPTVIDDIEVRGLSNPWDRLALVANCCQYTIRLDSAALSRRQYSLSLSMLAMCLLNGEILNNGESVCSDVPTSIAELTTSQSLKKLMFRGFSAPEDDNRRLTFVKGCRFTDVELTAGGIATKGHLWKLGHVIDTAGFCRKLPWICEPNGRLGLKDRKRLQQLADYLDEEGYSPLANQINKYLAHDAKAEEFASFTEVYLYKMAVELATAIKWGWKLRLGSICHSTGEYSPYRAVFVWRHKGGRGMHRRPPAFVFTSAWQGDPGSQAHASNDIDRHVSLGVRLDDCSPNCPKRRLWVCRWMFGMCFFDGCARSSVVFPWPRALHAI